MHKKESNNKRRIRKTRKNSTLIFIIFSKNTETAKIKIPRRKLKIIP